MGKVLEVTTSNGLVTHYKNINLHKGGTSYIPLAGKYVGTLEGLAVILEQSVVAVSEDGDIPDAMIKPFQRIRWVNKPSPKTVTGRPKNPPKL